MKVAVKLHPGTFGEYEIPDYRVEVSRYGDRVRATFENRAQEGWPKGGYISMPAVVAARLGHALLLASSGDLEQAASFVVDEAKM